MDLESLQQKVKSEIELGKNFIEPKREIFRERLVKYIDQDKDQDKIGVNTIYSMINLGIAIRLTDESSVMFMPRQFGDEEYADNLTNLAAFDYEEMGLDRLEYARHWDSMFFGYAIKTRSGWDNVKQVPIITQEDPLTWIPDPNMDYITAPRFHYFEKEMLKSSMTEDYGFDEGKVAELTNEENEDLKTNKTYRNNASGLNDVPEDTSEDFYVSVCDGYTYFDGDLYLVTLAQTGELIRAEKIDAVRKEEKKEGFVDIKTCVQIEWFSPLRGNACGVSLVDLIIDKQTANSQLMNLRLIDAKFSTFGQTNLVNTDIVKNTAELTKPSVNTKWIGVNASGQNLSNAVYPVPRQSIMQDSYAVSSELSKQIQLDTGISENTLGVAEKNITLGQSQQVQANANIRLALGITVSNWGEKDFWNFIWLRSYEEYFGKADKKIVRVANGFGVNVVEIRKDDFLGGQNPDIIIESKKKVESDREKMKVNFLSMLPYFTNDPSKPTVVKNIALRYSLKLQGMTKEMINILTYDQNEEKAKEIVHLLNADDMTGTIVSDLGEDHLTFMLIFESALDTKAKRIAIQNRRQAYILSGQVGLQKESADGGMVNQTQAMNTSAALSQGAKENVNLGQISGQ